MTLQNREGGDATTPTSSSGSHRSSSSGSGFRTESHDEYLTFPEAAPTDVLTFRFVSDYFVRRVEFEFRDVELP